MKLYKQNENSPNLPMHVWPAELSDLRKALAEHGMVAVPQLPDCGICANRGKVNGLSQESFCEQCVWSNSWKQDHFQAAQEDQE